MPYVHRNHEGAIFAVSLEAPEGDAEWQDNDHPEVVAFMQGMQSDSHSERLQIEQQLNRSDLEMVRVIEDVLELLISKNLLMFTDLPLPAQQKLLARRQLRGQLGSNHSILLDENGIL